MIKKLTQQDNEKLMEYLKEEKSFNLFIIGDVENFGYNKDFQEVYAEIDKSGNIIGVLLRYYHYYVAYSKGDFDVDGFVQIIKKDKDFEVLSGKKKIIEKFADKINFGNKRELYFAELTDDKLLEDIDLSMVRKAKMEDVELIFELREQIEEFDITPSSRETFKQAIETGTGRTFFIEKDNKAVACASTTAENSLSAMVVGVCTLSQYRKMGFATKCMTVLCKEVLEEGKELCLFYDNPEAGKIYKRIGFKDIGKWSMYLAKKK